LKNGTSVGVAVITHNSRHHLRNCLPPLLQSDLQPRVLVVNSSSGDGTVELAQELGADVRIIPRRQFNHGATREMARKELGTDIVVMITPDAYPCGAETLQRLVGPLLHGNAAVTYARQIPHDRADFFEAFPRSFNYPPYSNTRTIADVTRQGTYTFFCSNSCAAYVNSVLDEVGGFEATLAEEDSFIVAKILQHGYKIAYVAEAVVRHSHRYTLRQEFSHYFDRGYVRAEKPWMTQLAGRAERRGAEFAKTMLSELWRVAPSAVPYGVLQLCFKWAGFRVGYLCFRAPVWLQSRLSSQDFYWNSDYGPASKNH
jgi:rhamnosyltransferase